MKGNLKPVRRSALLATLVAGGIAGEVLAFPRFDGLGIEIERIKANVESVEARIQRGELPVTQVTAEQINLSKQQLAGLGPHLPELRRYWAEQGRVHAQRDLAQGRKRLFYVIRPRSMDPGPFPFRMPPLDEFELLLNDRLGASLVRVHEIPYHQGDFAANYFAVKTRCDGYNMEVERHLTEKHGGDIVSLLWRQAEREARRAKFPMPTAREVWLPFAACGASSCLLAGLALIRRRRERRGVSGFSAALQ